MYFLKYFHIYRVTKFQESGFLKTTFENYYLIWAENKGLFGLLRNASTQVVVPEPGLPHVNFFNTMKLFKITFFMLLFATFALVAEVQHLTKVVRLFYGLILGTYIK